MLTIKNIDSLTNTYVGHWKVHLVLTTPEYYNIKVIHNGSPFDMFNLIIERVRTKHGDYAILCYDTQKKTHIPIESIRDKFEFLQFLIDELI